MNGLKLLVLLTDAYGGRGGIAKFNCDLLSSLCSHPAVERVIAVPRIPGSWTKQLPEGLEYRAVGRAGKAHYAARVLKIVVRGRFEGVVCGHIHLLPLAWMAARRAQVPLVLVVHGIEAWKPERWSIVGRLVSRVNAVVSVSETTKRRFQSWSGLPDQRFLVLPNCIDLREFTPGPKREDLLLRYGLKGRTVLFTLGRLSASERYKGVDEVLEVLESLAQKIPDIIYLVGGEGDDRSRLERKAGNLRLSNRVFFSGWVSEGEKADHYRLADAFVMPGRGEGFGIVYLEAMACGAPVVASSADASHEAVKDGALGVVVDPGNPTDLEAGILEALASGRGRVPQGLEYFSFERFKKRWHRVVDRVFVVRDQRTVMGLGVCAGHRKGRVVVDV